MILTTCEYVPNKKVSENLGIARGSTVRARNALRDLMAGLKSVVGGEIEEYTKLQAYAREQAVERMIEAANRDELMSFSSINHEFHSIIIKNAGNEILLKTWQTLHIQIKTFLIVDRQEKNLLEMANSHYQIIEAFKVFDAPRARNEVINHIHHNRPVI